jgi:hypothetical protein
MAPRKPWIEFTASKSYLSALGNVIIHWAYFESQFDYLIDIMRYKAEAEALSPKVPYSFKQRLSLFRKSSRICFGECPSLIKRLDHIHGEAKRLKDFRDALAHSTWAGDPSDGYLAITRSKDNKWEELEVTLPMLRRTAIDISAITRHAMALLLLGLRDHSFPLEPDERSALQEFRHRNLPRLPNPIPRP